MNVLGILCAQRRIMRVSEYNEPNRKCIFVRCSFSAQVRRELSELKRSVFEGAHLALSGFSAALGFPVFRLFARLTTRFCMLTTLKERALISNVQTFNNKHSKI